MAKGKTLKVFKIIALVLAAVLVLALFQVFVLPLFEKISSKNETHTDWMKDIDGSKLITDFIIPGTHDSATTICQIPFATRCQQLFIKEQLEAGFRMLDLRLAIDGDKIKLMHGFTTCGESIFKTLYFDSILEDVYKFLDENPSECVIFCVKHEYGDESSEDLDSMVSALINKNSEYWYTENEVPTLDEVRGKIVFLKRYSAGTNGMYVDWSDQGNSTFLESGNCVKKEFENYDVYVQDRYQYVLADKINAFLEDPSLLGDKPSFYFNYSSTAAKTVSFEPVNHPFSIAKKLNERLFSGDLSYVAPYEKYGKGFVIVDFGTSEIAEAIFSLNK